MQEIFTPDPAPTEYPRRERPTPRPDRFAFWAVVMAVVAMIAGVASADAGASDGGIGTGDDPDTTSTRSGKYATWWQNTSRRNKRWARRTSECESGGDPRAIGGGGTYRGAFQFTRRTWRTSPRSPGGDPIRYSWRTQAVVAVALKKRDGTGHWPVCG
jgi:hypothetical protein